MRIVSPLICSCLLATATFIGGCDKKESAHDGHEQATEWSAPSSAAQTAFAEPLVAPSGKPTNREIDLAMGWKPDARFSLEGIGDYSLVERAPGHALRPALMIHFPEMPIAKVVDIRQQFWERESNLAYDVLIRFDGNWMPLPLVDQQNIRVSEIALSVDIPSEVRSDSAPEFAVERALADSTDYAERLGGRVSGRMSVKETQQAAETIRAVLDNESPDISVNVWATDPKGFQGAQIHAILRRLGFEASAFGDDQYEWRSQDESVPLLSVLPICHFETRLSSNPANTCRMTIAFDQPTARYAGLSVTFDSDEVPAPDILVDRLWQTAHELANKLGGRVSGASTGAPQTEQKAKGLLNGKLKRLRAAGLILESKTRGK